MSKDTFARYVNRLPMRRSRPKPTRGATASVSGVEMAFLLPECLAALEDRRREPGALRNDLMVDGVRVRPGDRIGGEDRHGVGNERATRDAHRLGRVLLRRGGRADGERREGEWDQGQRARERALP